MKNCPKLFARFARSGCIRLHKNVDFLEFKALKSGFAGSLGATFQCNARRHSLYIYRKDSNCTHTDKNEPYLFQHFTSESQKHTSSLATFYH